MRRVLYAVLTPLLLVSVGKGVVAQTAGQSTLGVTVVELADVVKGWSAQRQLLGQSVYNDSDEKIGKIEDIIVTPERSVSYAIVGSGGFLGIGSHDVAIPAQQFHMTKDRLVLPGATKDKLRAMPPFEYSRK